MTTFIWREILTVSVGEMSRTQALECCRKFDALKSLYPHYDTSVNDYAELMSEADLLAVMSAPVVVKYKGEPVGWGEQCVELEEDTFRLTLPLTRKSFDLMPMSLTTAWVNAALLSNAWFIDTLKKAMGLTSMLSYVPESGSAVSNEPTKASQTTTTIGQ